MIRKLISQWALSPPLSRHGVAEKITPAKFVPAKFLPAKFLPAKFLPAKFLPAKFLPAKFLPGKFVSAAGKTVVLTGASSGIGAAAARLLASRGASVILVARDREALEAVRDEIHASGGKATIAPADLTDGDAVDALVKTLVTDCGRIDILVNNAGRSIRRSALDSVERFHDYERTMALNYFGAARLTLGVLPSLIEWGGGHIVNVATWGVPAGVMPYFTAYHASKAALAAFGRSLGAEHKHQGIRVSTVNFPLVRTPMIAPTQGYRGMPALTPEQAASWILRAIEAQEVAVTPRYAYILRALDTFAPSAVDAVLRRSGI